MRFTEKTVTMPLEILYSDHFVGMPYMVPSAGVTPDADGKKIVKAGTIYPANDATAKGVLLHDTDVTYGDAPGTIVIHGFIDNAKLVKNGIIVASAAVLALKMIDFVGYTASQGGN